MIEDTGCPTCGSTLESFANNGLMGQRCNECGWMVVATDPHRISFDETIYSFDLSDSPIDTDAIRVVSRLMDINFLEAKLMLEGRPRLTVLRGLARDIDAKVAVLRKSNLSYRENPIYPYS